MWVAGRSSGPTNANQMRAELSKRPMSGYSIFVSAERPEPELLRAMVEQAPDALIFADREGTIRVWNARAEALFGHAASEALGESLDLIIPPHLRAAHWHGYRQAIAAGRTRSGGKPMLTRATHKDGGKLYVEVAFAIVSDERREILGALATARKPSRP
jgi:PAS domain S-box-containing protein